MKANTAQLEASRSARPNQLLGAKDLIIRMLAEVFHVDQCEDGQLVWRQLSTSLVPVSLYSRTTSKWLNYLLVASSVVASNTANAMSPDSRDFLLLLQQFHLQNHRCSQTMDGSERSPIVFQVVAHDYANGKCKKVLNIKLLQPGSRLGLASDHFVYWKSSPACCQSAADLHTWGLNFASVNDAKLFYDICSLNLVDLDFNSEYLKYLAINEQQLAAWPSQLAQATGRSAQPYCSQCVRIPKNESRTRSRSTTRQQSDQIEPGHKMARMRSFSTPASPEAAANQQQLSGADPGLVHGRQEAKRPEKPVRGVMREEQPPGDLSMFTNSRASQRRHTHIENSTHLDSMSRPADAQLARKLYANSKNMKEFLSLDAGGLQSTPKQTGAKRLAATNLDQPAGQALESNKNREEEQPVDATRNASTTTDDLPLDPATKRRMLKLTSGEGAEVANRSWSGRSETGRRRSLERSGRIESPQSQQAVAACCPAAAAVQSSRLASFKSAPDVCQVSSLGRLGVSAYAVPLCSDRLLGYEPSWAGLEVRSCPSSLRRQRPCTSRTQQEYAAPPICRTCMQVGVLGSISSMGGKQSSLGDKSSTTMAARNQLDNQERPCSSISSRSPLRYGLYESDCEREDERQQRRDCISGQHINSPSLGAIGRSTSGDQLQWEPAELTSGRALKPVLGYDQTMARKGRRRARSQPPGASTARPDSELDSDLDSNQQAHAAHLSKSMENVQKLIREVQNELDLLQRRSELCSLPSSAGRNKKVSS